MGLRQIRSLVERRESKIVLLVMDGLGGHPSSGGRTELEAARTPNFDALAAEGITGLHLPVGSGITPGSGPGHLGLFGYDPLTYVIGRGALSAAGIGFELQEGDVAARGNFCTVDADGNVVDRRAGRIDTGKNRRLCEKLGAISIPGVKLFVQPIKEHRFLLVMRGEGLSDEIGDTDPQRTGTPPLKPHPRVDKAGRTAGIVETFVTKARNTLGDQNGANMVLLRGFAAAPAWPRFPDVFGVRSGAIAAYPMYRGLAKLLGMDVLPQAENIDEIFSLLKENFADFDFFFVHVKGVDSRGEDGDFESKVAAIEEVDGHVPDIRALDPDVVVVTGDHSTPSILRSHSWHPVPVLLWSEVCRPDDVTVFGERACVHGALGPRLPAVELMPLALANAQRLRKYGA